MTLSRGGSLTDAPRPRAPTAARGASAGAPRPVVILNAFATRAGGSVARLHEVSRRAPAAWNAEVVLVHNAEIQPDADVPAVTLPPPLDRMPALPRRLLEPWLIRRALRRAGGGGAIIHYGSYVPVRRRPRARNILYFINMAPWDPGVGGSTPRNRILRRLFEATIGRADLLIVQSEATRSFLRARYPRLTVPVTVLRNGCSIPRLVRPASPRDFIAVGHVYRYRRLEQVIRAYGRLPAAVREAHRLVIVGHLGRDADAVGLVRGEIERFGLERHVRLTGPLRREAVLDTLVSACAFVSFAAVDNGPNAVQEAGLLGVPLILSDIPVHRELAAGGARFAADEQGVTSAMTAAAAACTRAAEATPLGPIDTWDSHVMELGRLLHGMGALPR